MMWKVKGTQFPSEGAGTKPLPFPPRSPFLLKLELLRGADRQLLWLGDRVL